jgi:hypothetical protein
MGELTMKDGLHSSIGRAAIAAAVAIGVVLMAVVPARAGSITFGTPTATSKFLQGIDFSQPYTGGSGMKEVDIVFQIEGVFGTSVAQVENPGSSVFDYVFDTSAGELEANTSVTAHFHVTFTDGSTQDGPSISITYADDRFDWHTMTGKLVRIHWYEGDDNFARQALQMGENGIADAASFLGYAETKPIDFFVYADQQSFYDALGPGTRDNVGGQANPDIRTLFALVAPDELSYAATVVPHELTHVVFDDVTRNPYHFPPHWLNEGIAVYVSQGFDNSDRNRVATAVSNGTLMPLSAIRGQFPTTQAQFYLAYAESVSAVDYFIRTYGGPAMKKLVATFGTGASDDEAFTAAIGIGVDEFDRRWQQSVGVSAIPSYGPQPAPTGPLPPGWTSTGLGGASSSTGPSSQPAVSPSVSLSGSSNASSGASGAGGGSSSGIPATALAGGGLLGLGGLIAYGLRRSRPRSLG